MEVHGVGDWTSWLLDLPDLNFWRLPSGKRLQFAKLKPWPSRNSGFTHFHSMVDLSIVVCKRLPEGISYPSYPPYIPVSRVSSRPCENGYGWEIHGVPWPSTAEARFRRVFSDAFNTQQESYSAEAGGFLWWQGAKKWWLNQQNHRFKEQHSGFIWDLC